jgi:hypothetical protein
MLRTKKATTNTMIDAGIAAIVTLTSKKTIDQNGILTSVTTTRFSLWSFIDYSWVWRDRDVGLGNESLNASI